VAGAPGLVRVAEVEVAQRAGDGDLADRGQGAAAESAGLRLQRVERLADLALLQGDVGAPPLVLRQRDLPPARLRGVEDAVGQRLLAQRGPARGARGGK
jgi:hypothetical protein